MITQFPIQTSGLRLCSISAVCVDAEADEIWSLTARVVESRDPDQFVGRAPVAGPMDPGSSDLVSQSQLSTPAPRCERLFSNMRNRRHFFFFPDSSNFSCYVLTQDIKPGKRKVHTFTLRALSLLHSAVSTRPGAAVSTLLKVSPCR